MKWNLSVEDKLEIFKKRGAEIHQGKDSYEKSIYKSANEDIIVTCLIHGDYTITPHRYLNKKNRCPKCSNYKKLLIDDWKLKCNEKFNNQYDYSNVYFKTTLDIVTIKCKSCGNEFSVTANSHLLGKKCPVCSKNSQSKTLEDYRILGNFIHNNKYKYLDLYIEDSRAILRIECPEHGVFTQKAYYHINLKCGCPQCAHNYKGSTENFIEQSKTIHGDIFDYSKVIYKQTNDYVTLICKVCGYEFFQTPHNHIAGKSGCPNCAGKVKINKEIFLEKSNKKHKEGKYSYDEIEEVNGCEDKVQIYCNTCNKFFTQTAYEHYKLGSGCPNCGGTKKLTKEEFIEKSIAIHGNKYDYHKVEYINNRTHVDIICPDHGIFPQLPNNHLLGAGCPNCSYKISKQEQELFDILHKSFPDAVQSERNIIKGEIDIYIPSKKVAIEFNGTYYHSELFRDKEYHYNKSMECEEKGIRLIHIWEYEWNNERQRPILINIIKNSLGMNAERIYARKCQIKILETSEVKDFFEKNNIQGFRGGKFAICLFHKNELVMSYIMGACFFGKGKYEWEVIRGATKLGVTVIGGSSKIWNYFLNTYNPKNCVYYIDFNYFNGNSLKHLNLEYLQTKPSFKNYWVKTGIVKNREPFKHKEIKELREKGEVVQINNAGVKVYKYERKD